MKINIWWRGWLRIIVPTLICFWGTAVAQALMIPGTHLSAEAFPSSLPWKFQLEEASAKILRYRSVKPCSIDERGKLYLRFELNTEEFTNERAALQAYDVLLSHADHNTGLTYAQDYVIVSAHYLWHLSVPNTFSRKNFEILVSRLKTAVREEAGPLKAVTCTPTCHASEIEK